jgi:integrase
LIVLAAVTAGLRISEVLGLKPECIDAERQTLEVQRRWHRGDDSQPKTENAQRVRSFRPGKASDDFTFARSDGNPPDDRDLQQHVFRPAAEALGIYHEGFGMHVFRRLNITWRQQAGATPFEAQKAAGHAKPDTTWLYTITDEERERQHVDWIWERITARPVGGVQ